MSFARRTGGSGPSTTAGHAARFVRPQQGRSTRSGRLCDATLACVRCDAPISPGGRPLGLSDRLLCPFCGHAGPVRDFLSLATPTRPARVVVYLSRPDVSAAG